MTNKHRELAVKALKQMKGDDLFRAKSAFKGCTEKQMEEQYGNSGRTRKEIISEYEQCESDINEAISWVKGLK